MSGNGSQAESVENAGCCGLVFGGATLTLTGDRAIWWAAERALLIADVHLGKPASFRARGAPVPEDVTGGDLARLDALVRRFDADTVVVLGDLAHDRAAWEATTLDAFSAWRGAHAGRRVVLVRGNHDRWAADPPASLGIEVVEPGWVFGDEGGGLAMHHEPPVLDAGGAGGRGRPALCGHVHPGVRLRRGPAGGAGGMRAACYRRSEGSPGARW